MKNFIKLLALATMFVLVGNEAWAQQPPPPTAGGARLAAPTTEFVVYPTFFSDNFNVVFDKMQKSKVSVSIYSNNGQLVMNHVETPSRGKKAFSLSVADIPPGSYIVEIRTSHLLSTRKVIKVS